MQPRTSGQSNKVQTSSRKTTSFGLGEMFEYTTRLIEHCEQCECSRPRCGGMGGSISRIFSRHSGSEIGKTNVRAYRDCDKDNTSPTKVRLVSCSLLRSLSAVLIMIYHCQESRYIRLASRSRVPPKKYCKAAEQQLMWYLRAAAAWL